MSNLYFADPPRNAFYQRNAANAAILSDEAAQLIEEKTKQLLETEMNRVLQLIDSRHAEHDQRFQAIHNELSDLRQQIQLRPVKDPKAGNEDRDDDGPEDENDEVEHNDEDKDEAEDNDDDEVLDEKDEGDGDDDDDEDDKGDDDDKDASNDKVDADDDNADDPNRDVAAKGFSSEITKSPWRRERKKHP